MKRNKVLAWMGALALLLAVGCGGGDEGSGRSARPSRPASGAGGGETSPASGGGGTGTAVVKGAVQFSGEAPAAAKIRMDADPFCHKAHAEGVMTEDVVVNGNGTLKNVFVYVKGGLSGSYPPPETPAQIDQHGCTYHPHVLGIQVGQPLKILNSDDTLHNIHAHGKSNKQFNIAMPKYVKEKEETFQAVEVMVPIKCDVHSWMATYIGVVDNPFYQVTGDDGSFSLQNLPAGTYTVEAWHEKYGTQTQEVTVGDGETSELTFTFQAS